MADALLQCLNVLCRLEKRPFSEHAIKAGLPLEDNRLTPDVFAKAAARVGFKARLTQCTLQALDKHKYPLILLLEDDQAWVLTKIEDGQYHVYQNNEQQDPTVVDEQTLAQVFGGYALLIDVEYDFQARSEDIPVQSETSWFWDSLYQYKHTFGHIIIATCLINIFMLVAPIFIVIVYDRIVPHNATVTLWVLFAGVVIFFLFDLMARLLRSYLVDSLGKRTDGELSAQLFEKMLSLKMRDKPTSAGGFASYFNEFAALRDFYTSATIIGVIDLPFIILFLVAMWMIGGSIVIIPIIAAVLILFIAALLELPAKKALKKTLAGARQKQAILIEAIAGIETIKVIGGESDIQKRWNNSTHKGGKATALSRLFSGLTSNMTVFIQQMVTISIVTYGVYLITNGSLTVGGLVACTVLGGRAVNLGSVASLLTRYERSQIALKALDKLMNLPSEQSECHKKLHRSKIEGHIELNHVNFFYPNQKTAALEDVNLKIKVGEHVGIIGRIGSGKSSLLKLMVGLYEPTTGAVMVDNAEATEIQIADLRKHIHYVPHDSTLFYGSVRDNIMLGADHNDDERMLKAANIAGVDQFVQHHPDSYEMPVGERGETLSGGQRQAVVLARALVSDYSVLLLDEPTASVDNSFEADFMAAIKTEVADKTMVLVTHRASMLALVDRIIVMDGGRIVADGPKDEILKALQGTVQPVNQPNKDEDMPHEP